MVPKLILKLFKQCVKGGTFSPMCPERYLYANSSKVAKAYSNACKGKMRARFPLTYEFTKRNPMKVN